MFALVWITLQELTGQFWGSLQTEVGWLASWNPSDSSLCNFHSAWQTCLLWHLRHVDAHKEIKKQLNVSISPDCVCPWFIFLMPQSKQEELLVIRLHLFPSACKDLCFEVVFCHCFRHFHWKLIFSLSINFFLSIFQHFICSQQQKETNCTSL